MNKERLLVFLRDPFQTKARKKRQAGLGSQFSSTVEFAEELKKAKEANLGGDVFVNRSTGSITNKSQEQVGGIVQTPVSEAITEAQQREADAAKADAEPTRTAVEEANIRAGTFGFEENLFEEPDEAALSLTEKQRQDKLKFETQAAFRTEELDTSAKSAQDISARSVSAAKSKLGQGREGAVASARTEAIGSIGRGATELQRRFQNKIQAAKNEIAFRREELDELQKKNRQEFTLADLEREDKIKTTLAKAETELLKAQDAAAEGGAKASQRMFDLVKNLGGAEGIADLSGSKFASLVASQTGANEKDALAFHSLAMELKEAKDPGEKNEILARVEKMFGDEPTADQRNLATLIALPDILSKIGDLSRDQRDEIVQSARVAAGVSAKAETPAQKSSREAVEALTRYRDEQTAQLGQKNLRNQGIPVIQDGQGGIILGIQDGEKLDIAGTPRDEGQCGAMVNDYLGTPGMFGATYRSKANNVNSQAPAPGSVFVLDTNDENGHCGVVEQVFADGSMQIGHSNYNLDGKFKRETWTPDEMRANGLIGYFSGDAGGAEAGVQDLFKGVGDAIAQPAATVEKTEVTAPGGETVEKTEVKVSGVEIRDKFLAGDRSEESFQETTKKLKAAGFTDEQIKEMFDAIRKSEAKELTQEGFDAL